MSDEISLSIAIISTVFIVGLMATYVQIMNRLIDNKEDLRPIKKNSTLKQKDYDKLKKMSVYLELLTFQIFLFFSSLVPLVYMTITLLLKLSNKKVIWASMIFIGIFMLSQILHFFVFFRSYRKYIWSYYEINNIKIHTPIMRQVCDILCKVLKYFMSK